MNVSDVKRQFETFRNATIAARAASERDEDYDHHHQWDESDAQVLEERGQAPVVINRVKQKVNLLTGIQRKTRTQPRALPRTPKHEDAADAATEALRYVVDNNNFKIKSSAAFRSEIVAGYGGVIVETRDTGKEKEVAITEVPWDRYYYDPHSRKLDFADKKYDGIVIWMDAADVADTFDIDTDKLFSIGDDGDDTFDDKPIWIDRKRKRLRVCQHFFLEKDVWMMAYFSGDQFLIEPKESPYKDEFGRPQNPIEMQTAYIDRQLQRYGEVRSYIWLQDEINHRRSRLLYAGSVTRTMGEKGAVDDVNELKNELAKANGHITYNKGFQFEVLPNDAISETQLLLYQESKSEIDEIGANSALAGRGNSRSGRQDQIQQQAGQVELASLYDGHRDWENRVYRQVWNRVKHIWKAEKWIRVTDDRSNLQWVGLNTPTTLGEQLQGAQGDPQAQALLQQMIAAQDPRLNQTVVQNNVAEMDVDIIIDEAPDTHTLQQETFERLMDLAERYGAQEVPFLAALELSDLPNKSEVKKLLAPPEQARVMQDAMLQLEMEDKKVSIESKKARADKDVAETEAQVIENAVFKSGLGNVLADRDLETTAKHLDNIQKQVETIKLASEPTSSVNVNT